ncbi:MAG: hypothetical protein A2289_03730 [Deltaproteobacteria bacterium RIFOXYA12_FULL_58_15]|nr:MAG: hypothetical protein A2289_03730 [Deltaproteobacteria bacterium RIFOXYA12_FULL_58_15]OGR08483.1 MAG: hypothetical protein A2341_02915 [Deltaproteobacteria bacterium RIFOXYB12_FULL_58_9]
MRYVALICCAAPLVVVGEVGAAAVGAAEVGLGDVSLTNTFIAEGRVDNKNQSSDDDNYGGVINRLNINGTSGDLRADLRLDGVGFVEVPTPAYVSELRLERITVGYRIKDLEITGGDFYRQLGRGLALSIRKQDEIGLDVALRGGELRYESDWHQATAFAGYVNPTNLDAVSQKHLRNPGDAIVGASYELRGFDRLTAGVFGVYLQPKERLLDERDSTAAAGGWVEIPSIADVGAVYVEGDAQRKTLVGLGSWGYAAYGTADLQLGGTVILLEGIFLRDYEMRGSTNTALQTRFVYNRAPTLQRIEEETIASPNVLGGRLKIEHYFAALDLVVSANGLFNLAEFGEPAEVRQLHGWGAGEWTLSDGGRLALGGGFRDESQAGELVRRMVHGEVDYVQPVAARVALHLASNTESREVPEVTGVAGDTRRYVRGSTFLGVERAGLGSLTFEIGYDTQDPSAGVRDVFAAGIIAWELAGALSLAITAGTQRGGIKCLSGVCREYPAFAGGRLEVIGRL